MATAVKQVPIRDFTSQLRQFPETAFDQTEQIRKFLQDAPLNPDSLAPYLTWDRQHYTRNLIDKTSLYELVAICWEVGQASSVHNHRDQNCWMAVPIGRLLVENFHVVHQDIAGGKCAIKATETVEMNVSHPCAVDPLAPVHRVFNPREFNQRAVSVHIYSRPFDTCVVYSAEQGTCGEIQLHYNTQYGKPVPLMNQETRIRLLLFFLGAALILAAVACQKTKPPTEEILPMDRVAPSPVGTSQTILHKTFTVKKSVTFSFDIPSHAVRPHLHGIFESFISEAHRALDDEANVDFLILNAGQYADLTSNRPSEALFSVEASHNQSVNLDLPASLDQPVKYYLVFRSDAGKGPSRVVEADFHVDF